MQPRSPRSCRNLDAVFNDEQYFVVLHRRQPLNQRLHKVHNSYIYSENVLRTRDVQKLLYTQNTHHFVKLVSLLITKIHHQSELFTSTIICNRTVLV